MSFIPFGGLVVSIYFALKGNRWAWEAGSYSTKQELRTTERKWAAAGLIFIGVIVALAIIVVAAGA